MRFQPSCLLVTGAAGFIGSNFVRHQLGNYPGQRVISLDALTYAGSSKNLEDLPNAEQHEFVKGNICDGELVKRLLRQNHIDAIVHFAAESHVDRSIEDPEAFIQTNLVGTYTLLEAVRNVWLNEREWSYNQCRFHHISTDEVFGSLHKDDPAFTEANAYAPNSPYSATKAGSDHLVRAYHHTYGLPFTISNCSNNYGPYQHKEKLIPTIIRACQQQQVIPIYGDGSNIRDWLYVEDHCVGIDTVLRRGTVGECYNLGGDNEWANLDIAKTICQQFDKRFPDNAQHEELIQFVTDRPGHDWRYAIDSSKIKQELDWQATTDFASGIAKTIDFYLAE